MSALLETPAPLCAKRGRLRTVVFSPPPPSGYRQQQCALAPIGRRFAGFRHGRGALCCRRFPLETGRRGAPRRFRRKRECSGASRELSRARRRRVHPNSRSQRAPYEAVSSTRFGSAPHSCNKRASALVRPTARQTRAPWQFRWRTEKAGASNLLASTRLNPAHFGSLFECMMLLYWQCRSIRRNTYGVTRQVEPK